MSTGTFGLLCFFVHVLSRLRQRVSSTAPNKVEPEVRMLPTILAKSCDKASNPETAWLTKPTYLL